MINIMVKHLKTSKQVLYIIQAHLRYIIHNPSIRTECLTEARPA